MIAFDPSKVEFSLINSNNGGIAQWLNETLRERLDWLPGSKFHKALERGLGVTVSLPDSTERPKIKVNE